MLSYAKFDFDRHTCLVRFHADGDGVGGVCEELAAAEIAAGASAPCEQWSGSPRRPDHEEQCPVNPAPSLRNS